MPSHLNVYLLLIIALVAVFAVSGCTQQEETSAFVGGTDGITAEFQGLPETIFPDVPFQLALLAKNSGEYPVQANAATFKLNNAQQFGITNYIENNKELMAPARRVQDTLIPGRQELILWGNAEFTGIGGVPITEEQPLTISADICYPYVSTGISRVCIAKTKDICEPIGEKSVQSSGAPIKVTMLKQIAQPSLTAGKVSLSLIIEIANEGKGNVYSNDVLCPDTVSASKDYVNVIGIKLGNTTYYNEAVIASICSQTAVSLSEGTGSVTCTLPDVTAATDFEEQLVMYFGYVYEETLTTSISVMPK